MNIFKAINTFYKLATMSSNVIELDDMESVNKYHKIQEDLTEATSNLVFALSKSKKLAETKSEFNNQLNKIIELMHSINALSGSLEMDASVEELKSYIDELKLLKDEISVPAINLIDKSEGDPEASKPFDSIMLAGKNIDSAEKALNEYNLMLQSKPLSKSKDQKYLGEIADIEL